MQKIRPDMDIGKNIQAIRYKNNMTPVSYTHLIDFFSKIPQKMFPLRYVLSCISIFFFFPAPHPSYFYLFLLKIIPYYETL